MRKWVTRATTVSTTILAAVGLAAAGSVPAAADGHDSPTVLHTVLTGAQEAPGPGDADGRGVFVGLADGDQLCYVLTARRIDPAAAAHIHLAPAGEPGPVVVPLEAPADGFTQACTTVPEDLLDAITADPSAYYVNVHNAAFPGGAIRGQLS